MSDTIIQFDAARHIYTVDGTVRPSVTHILDEVGLIDLEWCTEAAKNRGKAVHAACHYWDESDLDESWIRTSPYANYLGAWQRFRDESGFVPELREHRVFNQQYGYCGTLDRTGKMRGAKKCLDLIDIKTGQRDDWHGLQLAAYSAALPNPRQYRRLNVYLRDTGKYTVHEHPIGNYAEDVGDFLAAARVFFRQQKKGRVYGTSDRDGTVNESAA